MRFIYPRYVQARGEPGVSGARALSRQLAIATVVCWLLWQVTPGLAGQETSKPLWEIGLAGGAAWLPDYPASDENHPFGLVLPYAIYRGRIFRAGVRSIARGRFFLRDRIEFDLSLSGSFPTDSDGNEARRGMPDLDFLIEVGPRLRLTLAKIGEDAKVALELPVRAVFSIAVDAVGYRGVLFNPRLVYRHSDIFNTGVRFGVAVGVIFATDEFMAYFYDVDSQFATPTRREFDADPGYLGTRFSLALSRKISERVSVSVGVRVGFYKGATNADSPLFRSEVDLSFGFGFRVAIFRSKRRVTETEDE